MSLAAAIADHLRLIMLSGGGILVCGLLFVVFALYRYRRRPRRPAENGHLRADGKLLWGAVFAVILLLPAVSLARIAYLTGDLPKPDMVIHVIGRGGVWSYAYPDQGNFRFDSHRLNARTAKAYGQPYGQAVDFPLVIPVGKRVEIQATSADVSHIWSVPGLGVRLKAMPGRITRASMIAPEPGLYYGTADSGVDGLIAVEAKEADRYAGWLAWAKRVYGDDQAPADAASEYARPDSAGKE